MLANDTDADGDSLSRHPRRWSGARHDCAADQRRVHLHAGGRLPRRRFVQLQSERWPGRLECRGRLDRDRRDAVHGNRHDGGGLRGRDAERRLPSRRRPTAKSSCVRRRAANSRERRCRRTGRRACGIRTAPRQCRAERSPSTARGPERSRPIPPSAGRSLEFVATFTGAPYQHVGFGETFDVAAVGHRQHGRGRRPVRAHRVGQRQRRHAAPGRAARVAASLPHRLDADRRDVHGRRDGGRVRRDRRSTPRCGRSSATSPRATAR